MNWINTKVKPVVYMGLNQVKILQTCCFILTNQNDLFGQAKTISFLLFTSLNLDTCLFIQLKLMVHNYNSKNSSILWIFITKLAKWKLQSWFGHSSSTGFEPTSSRAKSRPLATQTEVHSISWVLHCFDFASPIQHFNS